MVVTRTNNSHRSNLTSNLPTGAKKKDERKYNGNIRIFTWSGRCSTTRCTRASRCERPGAMPTWARAMRRDLSRGHGLRGTRCFEGRLVIDIDLLLVPACIKAAALDGRPRRLELRSLAATAACFG